MKIGIHNEPNGKVLGGSEMAISVLAEALSESHQVEIVHHNDSRNLKRLAEFSKTDLSRVSYRVVTPEYEAPVLSLNWRRYRDAPRWYEKLSKPYDLFICSVHGLPPFCHAPRGALLIHFPWLNPRVTWPWTDAPPDAGLRGRLRNAYFDWEWRKRFESYQVKTANSNFTSKWAKLWWGINCRVVYAPADAKFAGGPKENVVLSVGRFATLAHTKKQLEMATAFGEMTEAHGLGWQYWSAGGVGESPEEMAYFDAVKRVGESHGAQRMLANLDRSTLEDVYARAKIFWHATGYGNDTETEPYLAEHFGITTVEAMGAGCVPVVINKGGQPEIVEHGVSGFIWDTLTELKEFTLLLMRDDSLRERMSEAARARARLFSREQFVARFSQALWPLLS